MSRYTGAAVSSMSLTQTEPASGGLISTGGVHRLVVVFSASAPDIGFCRTLRQEAVVIGRDPESNPCLALRHARVSRQHARVEWSEPTGSWHLRDLDSRNGTFVNGARVEAAQLHEGDIIRIGQSLLLFQYLDAEACEHVLELRRPPVGSMIGSGHAMAQVREAIASASEGVTTLIQGETGVGKELVARAVHEHSGRTGDFVPVNCSALPDSLVESELFGHVRGAFTGADARRGLFGRADRGTLFLDEIGELGLEVQAKLLRALALGEVRPVGSDEPRHVDVRVLAATNVELEQAVANGKFRPDLYARLMSHIVTVPPLRKRKEDILELVRYFLRDLGRVKLTADSAEALLIYGWPYNVRELEQVLAALAPKLDGRHVLELDDLPRRLREPLQSRFEASAPSDRIPVSLLDLRRNGSPNADELRSVFEAFGGNVARVAAFFGKDRRQIYRWADALEIDIRAVRARQ